jgi:hypothetical protein
MMYLGSLSSIFTGAAAVFLGTYFFSRMKEKQETETRLDRIEQMIQKLTEEKERKE